MDALQVADYRRLAEQRLRKDIWDFIDGGSGDELALTANQRAFDAILVRPRVMVDVSHIETGTTLLADPISAPLGVAPTAFHTLLHPDGEVGTAKGAGAAGVPFIVSLFASRTVEEIAAASSSPLWLQLYWLRQRDAMASVIARAEAAGFRALVLTVDAPVIGRRLRDLRNGFAVDSGVEAVNLEPELMAATHDRRPGGSAIADHALGAFDASLSWADLAWLRERTGMPILLKGILTAQDAQLAVEHGAQGVIVSNHGGRQLDAVGASLASLVEVVAAVAGRCPVLFDGGVRRGRDVFAALALGAQTVLLGRPVLWALAAGGSAGVAAMFDLLRAELAHTMALAGRPRLRQIDATAVGAARP